MLALELTGTQKVIYKALSESMTAKNGSSMEYIRNLVNIGHKMVMAKKRDTDTKIAENNDTKSKRLADEANIELQQELKTYISDTKTILNRKSKDFFSTKRDAVAQFIKQIPSDKISKKLEYLRDYGQFFDKSVWEVFVTDPEIASNFIASKILQNIANKNGIDYVMAFDYDRVNSKIDDFETMVNDSISRIDKETDIVLHSLIIDSPNSPVSKLIADLDSDISTIIPAPRKTVMNRLKQAEQHAFDVGDIRTSARIKAFYEIHSSDLATPEDIRETLLEQAENLITQGMSAKKDG